MNVMKPRPAEQATCSAKTELAESDVMKAPEDRPSSEEIVRCLELCDNGYSVAYECETQVNECKQCAYNLLGSDCVLQAIHDALIVIHEKDAEIERLKADLQTWKDIAHRETGYVKPQEPKPSPSLRIRNTNGYIRSKVDRLLKEMREAEDLLNNLENCKFEPENDT